MLVMIHTITTIIPIVSRNTRTTETIDQVGATSTVLAWIRTAFVDIFNTKIPPENMAPHFRFFSNVILVYYIFRN